MLEAFLSFLYNIILYLVVGFGIGIGCMFFILFFDFKDICKERIISFLSKYKSKKGDNCHEGTH